MVEEFVLEFARAEQAGDPFAFRFEPQPYLLRTAGGGFESSQFPWEPSVLADLAALRHPSCDRVVVQRIGELLRRFVTPLGFTEQAGRILAASRAGHQVLVTIRSAAAELYALPWELLTEKGSGQQIGGLPNVLLRYEWPETHTVVESPQPRIEQGRILFAWSSAAGSVPASEHAQAIRTACKSGFVTFSDEQDILPHASCQQLVAVLDKARNQNQPATVLHLLCHGSQTGSTFGLALHGEEPSESVVVDAATLRQILGPYANMIRLVVLSACDSGNTGAIGNQLGSVAQALHRAGFASVIASRHPLAVSASIKLTETLYQALLTETESLEQALLHVRDRLLRDPSQLDWASLQLYSRSEDGTDSRPIVFRPYRGLLAFQPHHGRFFFGRESEVATIKKSLSDLPTAQRPRFLIVAGASGSGKSSVVLAGVVPQLQAESNGRLRSVILRPGSSPLRALESALGSLPVGTTDLLIVIDQLEELFTHVSEAQKRTEFGQRIWNLAKQPNIQIIATLRVDFIGECGSIVLEEGDQGRRLDSVAYDEAHRVFIAQLGSDQLRSTIEGPARKVGLILEAGLSNRIAEAIGSEPGALPLLQHTLDLLWLRREGRTLSQSGYDAIGQVAGALSQHADALIVKMSTAQQQTARDLLVRLVHLDDGVARATRQRMPIERLRPSSKEEAERFLGVLSELVNARLLVQSGEESEQTVEVAHEALIRSWPRLLDWLVHDRQMLAELEKLDALLLQWRQHHALLSGEQLNFAQRLATEYPRHFPQEAQTLLKRSSKAARQDRAIKRSVLVLLVSGALFYLGESVIERFTNDRTNQARTQLAMLVNKTSKNPTTSEMLGTLARLRMELELRPELALELNSRARDLDPQNPGLLSDQAEYLLSSCRFAEAYGPAQTSYHATSDAMIRLHSAVVAWSAARFQKQEKELVMWGERALTEYQNLANGTEILSLTGTSQILFREQHQLSSAAALSDVLEVYAVLRGEKTETKSNVLAKRLRISMK